MRNCQFPYSVSYSAKSDILLLNCYPKFTIIWGERHEEIKWKRKTSQLELRQEVSHLCPLSSPQYELKTHKAEFSHQEIWLSYIVLIAESCSSPVFLASCYYYRIYLKLCSGTLSEKQYDTVLCPSQVLPSLSFNFLALVNLHYTVADQKKKKLSSTHSPASVKLDFL